MFYEAIAQKTADHFRDHIEDYLETISDGFTGSDQITMVVPKINSATLVGGVMQADVEDLPLLGIDCVDKSDIPSNESLWLYGYQGAIAGLVSASSADEVDRLAKRYAAAVEKFVKEHAFLADHTTGRPMGTNDFTLREFTYFGTSFSGAILVELEEQNPLWLDGFTCNVSWVTSEDQYKQHV